MGCVAGADDRNGQNVVADRTEDDTPYMAVSNLDNMKASRVADHIVVDSNFMDRLFAKQSSST